MGPKKVRIHTKRQKIKSVYERGRVPEIKRKGHRWGGVGKVTETPLTILQRVETVMGGLSERIGEGKAKFKKKDFPPPARSCKQRKNENTHGLHRFHGALRGKKMRDRSEIKKRS